MANCNCQGCGPCCGCASGGSCCGCASTGGSCCGCAARARATSCPVEAVAYESTSAWPEMGCLSQNTEAACLLRDFLAGETGKMTMAQEYLYQSAALAPTDTEMAGHMKALYLVEMAHAQRVAGVIAALGGDPVLRGSGECDCEYWSADCMSTACAPRTMLTRNIAAEEALIASGRRLCERIGIPFVTAFLERIAEDDRLQAALQRRLLAKLDA